MFVRRFPSCRSEALLLRPHELARFLRNSLYSLPSPNHLLRLSTPLASPSSWFLLQFFPSPTLWTGGRCTYAASTGGDHVTSNQSFGEGNGVSFLQNSKKVDEQDSVKGTRIPEKYLKMLQGGQRFADIETTNLIGNIRTLEEMGFHRNELPELVDYCPFLLSGKLQTIMVALLNVSKDLGFAKEDLVAYVQRYPKAARILNGGDLFERVDCLLKQDFSARQAGRLVKSLGLKRFLWMPVPRLHYTIKLLKALVKKEDRVCDMVREFPQVFDFSFKRSLKPKISFLLGLGLTAHTVGKVFASIPVILKNSSTTELGRVISFLERSGVDKRNARKLVKRYPEVLTFNESDLLHTYKFLNFVGLSRRALKDVLMWKPQVFKESIDECLKTKADFLVQIGLEKKTPDMGKALLCIFAEDCDLLEERVQLLRDLGFSPQEVLKMVKVKPEILTVAKENVQEKVHFLVHTLHRDVKELTRLPAFLVYSLEDRIKRRHRMLEWRRERGLLKREHLLTTTMGISDEDFIRRFVGFQPELRTVYRGDTEPCHPVEFKARKKKLKKCRTRKSLTLFALP